MLLCFLSMSLFSKIKKFFSRDISLLPHQKFDLVSFVKLKNDGIKIGSNLIVDADHNFVVVHYILETGYCVIFYYLIVQEYKTCIY